MLWVKAFHIVFVVSWFSGLFYLPRILVNLAMLPAQKTEPNAERERLLLMAGKLYRFMTPLAALSIALGVWLWLGYGIGKTSGWMHGKLFFVALALGYHHACGRLLKKFQQQRNTHSHVWYRWFNEVPVVILIAITILVVVKPF